MLRHMLAEGCAQALPSVHVLRGQIAPAVAVAVGDGPESCASVS